MGKAEKIVELFNEVDWDKFYFELPEIDKETVEILAKRFDIKITHWTELSVSFIDNGRHFKIEKGVECEWEIVKDVELFVQYKRGSTWFDTRTTIDNLNSTISRVMPDEWVAYDNYRQESVYSQDKITSIYSR